MGIFIWSQSLYGTGIAKIDEQHRDIFALANDFYDAYKALRGQQQLVELFNNLINHADEHFTLEESLMTQYAYPDQAGHQALHEDILRMLHDKRERFLEGELGIAGEMLEFLRDWLVEHVTNADLKLGVYLKQRLKAS